MASQGAFRAADYCFVFDGQSLNLASGGPSTAYPDEVTDQLSVPSPGVVVAIAGTSWTALYPTAPSRWAQYMKCAPTMVLCMNGGTADILDNDSGATLYADEVTYAELARAEGFDLVFNMTLVGNTVNTSPQNTARLDHNVLLLADAEDAFDGVGDVAANANLQDWSNPTYYSDGVHWTLASVQIAAGIMLPVLETAFA